MLLRHSEEAVRKAWVKVTADYFGCLVLPLHDGKEGDLPAAESVAMREARMRSLQQM
jgi:hypothetical protein